MSNPDRPRIIAIDGHNASGKSTISAIVAVRLGGKVARAFPGELGAMIGWLAETAAFKQANELAHRSMQKALADHPGADFLVFDRHWPTIFTLIPQEFRQSWMPLPPTVMCWADAVTTKSRLRERGVAAAGVAIHEPAIEKFRNIAHEFDLPVIDTTIASPDDAAQQVLDLCAKNLG